jgi:hypothetical protein
LLTNPKRNKPETVLIRIITNYFQIISLVQGFDLVWPTLIERGLSVFVKITDSQDSFFSIDCILNQIGFNPDLSYYMEVIIIGLVPIFVSLISIPFWILYNGISARRKLFLLRQQMKVAPAENNNQSQPPLRHT